MQADREDIPAERVICGIAGLLIGGLLGVVVESLRMMIGAVTNFGGMVVLCAAVAGALIGAITRNWVFNLLVGFGAVLYGMLHAVAPELLFIRDREREWPLWVGAVFFVGLAFGVALVFF